MTYDDCTDDEATEVLDDATPLRNFVYHEIRAELARRGIPPAQVAFIQEYQTKAKRAALFAAINRGDIRVLIASKQSTGMNIQQRLIALHHLDCPWRPGDLEQREGRIIRQGNQFPEAMVFAYVTEGSFDAFAWQTIETKAGFIEKMKRGDVTVREIDDIGDAVLSAAEIKAIASGNPLVMEKVKLEMHIQQLEAGEAADRNNRVMLRQTLVFNEHERQRNRKRLPFLAAAQAQAEATAEHPFKAGMLDDMLAQEITVHTKRQEAGAAAIKLLAELEALALIKHERQSCIIGRYRGFELHASAYAVGSTQIVVRYEHDGQCDHISTNEVSTKTETGVFQSIDALLCGIDREIAMINARIAEFDARDRTIATMLERPWEQELELRAAHERMERVDDQLQLNATEAIPPTVPTIPDPNNTMDCLSEDDIACASFAAPIDSLLAMERPLVLLPEPANPEAMAAAIRALSGMAGDAAETILVEPCDAAVVLSLPEELVTLAAIDVSSALPQNVLVVPPPASAQPARDRPIFGAITALPTVRRTPAKAALPLTTMERQQLDLFDTPSCAADLPLFATAEPEFQQAAFT